VVKRRADADQACRDIDGLGAGKPHYTYASAAGRCGYGGYRVDGLIVVLIRYWHGSGAERTGGWSSCFAS
jgi:hypothetical protein